MNYDVDIKLIVAAVVVGCIFLLMLVTGLLLFARRRRADEKSTLLFGSTAKSSRYLGMPSNDAKIDLSIENIQPNVAVLCSEPDCDATDDDEQFSYRPSSEGDSSLAMSRNGRNPRRQSHTAPEHASATLAPAPRSVSRDYHSLPRRPKRPLHAGDTLAPVVPGVKPALSFTGLSGQGARWAPVDSSDPESGAECAFAGARAAVWRLWFKIEFIKDESLLAVTVFRTKCTPEHHESAPRTVAFVTAVLLPDDSLLQTRSYGNTGSPSFDDTLAFRVPDKLLDQRALRLSLYDVDEQTRTRSSIPPVEKICLGHTLVKLGELKALGTQPQYLARELRQLSTAMDQPSPEMQVSLCYTPDEQKLKLQVYAARNMPDSPTGFMFYLRTQVILGRKTVKTKQTTPTRSLHSAFQCSYAFQVPMKHMDMCCIKFTVVRVTPDTGAEDNFGRLIIGPILYAHGAGVDHWKQMLQSSRRPVEMWHRVAPQPAAILHSGKAAARH